MNRGRAVRRTVTVLAALAVAAGASVPASASSATGPAWPSAGKPAAHVPAAAPINLGITGFGRILVDPATSHIFVSSPSDSAIVVLDFDGNIVKIITGEAGAWGMALRGSTLYVALNTAGAIDKIDTGTLSETGQLVSGLLRPSDLVLAGSKLWTTTGNCANWSVQLVSVDPAAATPTVVPYPTAFDSTNGLSYCAAFASNPRSNPNLLLAWDLGLEPANITSFDVTTGSPVELASARENVLGNLQDVAVNPDGTRFITASGAPYEFDQWKVSDLTQDGIIYPANAYPTAVATTAGNGGAMGGGLNGEYAPDFYAYRIGHPAAPLTMVDFGGPSDAFNTVPDRGVAFKPDGTSAFVVSLGSGGSGIVLNILPVPAAGAPTPPTGVAASVGIAAATVNWGAPVDQGNGPVSSYTVTSAPGGVTATTSQTSTVVIGLTPGVSYTFTVTATNAAGTSFPSSPSNAVVPWACGSPTNVSGTPGNGSVSLSWQPPANPGTSFIRGYRITPYVGPTAYGPTMVSGTPAPTSATVTGLTNGTAYTFIVACIINGAPGQDSAPSNPITPGAVPGSPSPPTNVWASPGSGIGTATVSWSAPANPGNSPVTSYTVTSSPGGMTATTSQTSVVISGLTPGVTYTFTVTAINATGTSLPSALSNQVVPWACGPPTSVQAVPGDSSAFVAWQPPTNPGASAVTSYGIAALVGNVAQGGDTFVNGTIGSPTPTSAIVSPLTNGTTYTFIVFCMINGARGPDSAPSNAVTPIQGGNYHPLTPARILDTRSAIGSPTQPMGNGETRAVQVRGQGGLPRDGVSAVVLNVTVTGPTSAGFLTVFPAGVQRPTASNLNFVAGQTVPNLVEVVLGAGGQVDVFTQFASAAGHADVIFDVAGWVGVATNSVVKEGLYQPLTPVRIMDTRSGLAVRPAPLGWGQTVDLNVSGMGGILAGQGVSAVVLNVTVTSPTVASYLTVFPTGGQQPTASNLNFVAGQTVPNRVIVKVGAGGKVSFYNAAGKVDVIVDIGGWFTDATSAAGGTRFTGIVPTRMIDTRDPTIGPLLGGKTDYFSLTDQNNNPVTGVSALVFNVTVTNPTMAGYVTMWPDGPPQPPVSDLNFAAGETVANLVVVKLGTSATVDIYNATGRTDLIMDLVGFYGVAVPAPSGATAAFSFRAGPLRQRLGR